MIIFFYFISDPTRCLSSNAFRRLPISLVVAQLFIKLAVSTMQLALIKAGQRYLLVRMDDLTEVDPGLYMSQGKQRILFYPIISSLVGCMNIGVGQL